MEHNISHQIMIYQRATLYYTVFLLFCPPSVLPKIILFLSAVVLCDSSPFPARHQEPLLVWGVLQWSPLWSVQEEPLHSALKELQDCVWPAEDQLPAALIPQKRQAVSSALLAILLHHRPTKVWHNGFVPQAAAAPRGQVQHDEGATLVDQETLWYVIRRWMAFLNVFSKYLKDSCNWGWNSSKRKKQMAENTLI